MIKINRKNKHYRRWVIIVAIIVVLALIAAALFVLYPKKDSPKPSSGASSSSTTQQETATPAKGAVTEQPTAATGGSVDVQLTASSQSDSTYQLRFQIDTISNSGQCTLVLTMDNKTVTKTASVQALARASTCQGFDVPLSELQSGTWHFTLTYSNSDDNLSGSATGTLDVK